MNVIEQIKKRAAHDGATVGGFAYPTSETTVGMAVPDGLEEATIDSAVFCITDGSVDRDGDVVNVDGLDFTNYAAAGAPVFFGHQAWLVPIGSCIDPTTGDLDVWKKGN